MACVGVARLVPISAPADCSGASGSFGCFVVPNGGALIGRREDCDIRLAGPTVSGQQCRLRRSPSRGGRFVLVDLSSNGTFVNGRKVGQQNVAELSHGDEIQLTSKAKAELTFRFESDLSPPIAANGDSNVRSEAAFPVATGTIQTSVGSAAAVLQTSRGVSPQVPLALPAVRPLQQAPSSEQASAVAEAEREAERMRLLAQRRVLVSEVTEQQALKERLAQQFEIADANAVRQRELRDRLFDEHDRALRVSAKLNGDILALRAFAKELEDGGGSEAEALTVALSKSALLEIQLSKLRDEARAANSKLEHVTQKACSQEARYAEVRKLATDFGEVLRSYASNLAEEVGNASTADSLAENIEPPPCVPKSFDGVQQSVSAPAAATVVGANLGGAEIPSVTEVDCDHSNMVSVYKPAPGDGLRPQAPGSLLLPNQKGSFGLESPGDAVVLVSHGSASPRGQRRSGTAGAPSAFSAASARRRRRASKSQPPSAGTSVALPGAPQNGVISDSRNAPPALVVEDPSVSASSNADAPSFPSRARRKATAELLSSARKRHRTEAWPRAVNVTPCVVSLSL